MLRQVANSYSKFLFKENIIFSIFHAHENTQFNKLSYFGKLQILGCYNSTRLKVNLVLETRLVLSQTNADMIFLDPLLFYKQPLLRCTDSTGVCTS